MSLPAIVFKGLLTTLAGQFIYKKEKIALCTEKDFGSRINSSAKKFFSISLIEEELPSDLAAVGVLCDDSAYLANRRAFTFFIYIDSSKKHKKITEDLKTIIAKLILAHETCHFAFYYELFIDLGANLSNTVYEQFQHTVSGKLQNAITSENNITSETVVEEHSYQELIKNFGSYPDSHFAKNCPSAIDYTQFFLSFFNYLTRK